MDRGPGPEKQLSPEIILFLNFLKDLLPWQGIHLITRHLLFLSSCESPSFYLKSWPLSYSLAQDVVSTSIAWLSLSLLSLWASVGT